ncbi:hypothetical protein RhiirA4_475734 [Rhizophagus irregularis]|uniref:Uncharacterized protein n=1 Tax=Rhizophagus irregularis TaxID=588596 RepID=A0A2I1HAN1_9GLOM|nr:hypothetical protein RhiirA4_475734 [Rhizophagus irregularis]
MEDSRNIQIAENSFPRNFGNNDKTTFLFEIFQNYLLFSESLFSSFFTGNDIEVQRNIIRTNFGLTDEDIQSWTNRASRYNMTPESMMSDSEDESPRPTISVDEVMKRAQKRLEDISKKSKKSKKSSKKKYQLGSSDDSDGSIQIKKMIQNSDDEKMFSDDDREITIDRPITKVSGSQSHVDHSLLNVTPSDQSVPLIIDVTPLSQEDTQLKNKADDSTKSSNKKKKSNTNQIQNVITGHKPTDDDTSRVRDILVYDIPVSWTPEEILKQLTLWGKTISMQTKPQRKYQTLRLKIELSTFRLAQFEVNENPVWTTDLGGIPVRWFPARWTLKERKQREKFQATIQKIPDSMTLATLWKDNHPHSFLTAIKGLKSFKIIQTAKGERKLIGYFEKWVDMRSALDNQYVWEQNNLSWSRYEPLTQPTRSRGINTNKNQERTSRSPRTDKNQQNSKNSDKKPKEMKSDKPNKQKKDKSRKESRSKVLAEILDLLRKIV